MIESRKTAAAKAREEAALAHLSPGLAEGASGAAGDDDDFAGVGRAAGHGSGKGESGGKAAGGKVQIATARVSILNIVDLAGSECLEKIFHPDEAKGKKLSLRRLIREGHHINKSLLSLKKVIGALAKQSGREDKAQARNARRPSVTVGKGVASIAMMAAKKHAAKKLDLGQKAAAHIGYRNSKLTQLLQMSLGGNCFTTVLCTMSPAALHADETVSTL